MSLKARIEAVIYAAEEPVTLQQLAALFREEALLSRASRSAPQPDPEAPSEAAVAPEPGLSESVVAELLPPEPDASRESHSENTGAPSEPAAQNSADAEVATPDFTGEPRRVPEPPATAASPTPAEMPSESAADLQAQSERAAARQRDREVRDEIRRILDELIAEYSSSDRGLEIREIAGGFRIGTRPEYHDSVRGFIKSLKPPMKLSLQALETLAVIAYKQPVTAPEIGEIRGVDSGGILGTLVARKLITTAGRKQVIGRPILYKTTKEFLLRFGLKDLNELPSIEEFEKMATELAEAEDAETPGEELPFAQNEIAALEESAEPGPGAPEPPVSEPETPVNDPPPNNPDGRPAPVTEPPPDRDSEPAPVEEPQP